MKESRERINEIKRALGVTIKDIKRYVGAEIMGPTIERKDGGYNRYSGRIAARLRELGISPEFIESGFGEMFLLPIDSIKRKIYGIKDNVPNVIKMETKKDTRHPDYKLPKWKYFVALIAILDHYICQYCHKDVRTLICNYTAHHIRYDTNRKRWEQATKYMACCCNDCNESLKAQKDANPNGFVDPHDDGMEREAVVYVVRAEGKAYPYTVYDPKEKEVIKELNNNFKEVL